MGAETKGRGSGSEYQVCRVTDAKAWEKNFGQSAREPVIIRAWMKSNFEVKVHSSSTSSISKVAFGGRLSNLVKSKFCKLQEELVQCWLNGRLGGRHP